MTVDNGLRVLLILIALHLLLDALTGWLDAGRPREPVPIRRATLTALMTVVMAISLAVVAVRGIS